MLLAMLGLLLAFTFSMASARYDTRRSLVVEEANDIGTVILRTDMYPDSVRQLLKANLQSYVEDRISFYEVGENPKEMNEYYAKADATGKKIWSIATNYAKVDGNTTIASQLIPALNAMIDITTTRSAATVDTIPDSIMYFLFLLCFCAAYLLGYESTQKIDWIRLMAFSVMLSITVFTIMDLDRPRGGFITMDAANQKIIELREMFNGN